MNDDKDMELQNQEELDSEKTDSTEENKEDPQYRGKVLMQRALKHLEEGNLEEFETNRALANKYFDEMSAEDDELDALYNESRNFGIIYQVLESNTANLLKSQRGHKALRDFVKTIKQDKVLHEQFKAYNNLMPHYRVNNVDDYINEALSMIPTFNKSEVKECNEKLIKLFKKNNLDEMIDIDDDKLELFEAIEYVTMNPKKLDNIDEYISAKNIIKESIAKLPINENKGMSIKDYSDEVVSISENIGKDLNSAEVKLLKEVYGENAEEYFNECKTITLKKLNEMMSNEKDMETKSRLSQIFEKINSKTYNKKNIAVDVSEMIEIQNTIDD